MNFYRCGNYVFRGTKGPLNPTGKIFWINDSFNDVNFNFDYDSIALVSHNLRSHYCNTMVKPSEFTLLSNENIKELASLYTIFLKRLVQHYQEMVDSATSDIYDVKLRECYIDTAFAVQNIVIHDVLDIMVSNLKIIVNSINYYEN